ARRERDGWVLQGTGQDRGHDRLRRMGSQRGHRRDRAERAVPDHRPQERADHHLGRQAHLPRQPGSAGQGQPDRRPGRRCRRRAELRLGPRRARSAGRSSLGEGTRDRCILHGELAEQEAVIDEIRRAMTAANTHLSRVEQFKRFTLLPTEWSPESEELTATLKLKRRVIYSKYGPQIEAMYASPPGGHAVDPSRETPEA